MKSKIKDLKDTPLTDYFLYEKNSVTKGSINNRKKYEMMFKETLPLDWEIVDVKNICDSIQSGFASGERDDNGILQLRMNNITIDGHVTIDSYLKVPIPTNITDHTLTNGDVLFNNTNSVDLIGKTAIFRDECINCTYSNHLTRIKVNNKITTPEWVLYNFIRMQRKGYFKRICQRHVGQAGISSSDLERTLIAKPPIPEQRKIATILSTVDMSIEATEKVISQIVLLKKGLIQDLFKKGIDHLNYRDTDLGKIPDSWEVVRLGDVVKELIVPMRDKPKRFEGTIPWCRIEDFDGKYLYTSKSDQFVNDKIIREMNLKIFPKGTVICSCSANLGVCAIAANDLITNQTFIGIIPDESLDNELLYYLMGSFAKRLQRQANGTTIAYLSREEFENFKIVKPPIDEQHKIASILSSIDEIAELYYQNHKKLELLKKGLMQVLLTGKIRVKVDS